VMYTGVPDPLAPRWCGQSGVFCVLVKGALVKDLLWSVEEACVPHRESVRPAARDAWTGGEPGEEDIGNAILYWWIETLLARC